MEKEITLNGQMITIEQLSEAKANLAPGERIVEVAPGQYETIRRMQG